jgi:hypothetical protein
MQCFLLNVVSVVKVKGFRAQSFKRSNCGLKTYKLVLVAFLQRTFLLLNCGLKLFLYLLKLLLGSLKLLCALLCCHSLVQEFLGQLLMNTYDGLGNLIVSLDIGDSVLVCLIFDIFSVGL